MPIAKITGRGLAAIAFSVAALWGCIIVEQVEHRAAVGDRVRVVRELQRMQQRHNSEPAAAPSPFTRHRLRVTAG